MKHVFACWLCIYLVIGGCEFEPWLTRCGPFHVTVHEPHE